tara:strand:- start:95 stop:499 length:405 start_codon:yes stop_codon:yes gene_type:complete
VINEDAPTMSAGTGGFSGSANANGPVAGFDPLLGSNREKKPKLTQRKPKKRKYTCKEGTQYTQEKQKANYLPFKVCYDGAQEYVLYGRSEAEIRIQLKKIYRPENFKKIYIKRLWPAQVIKFYWDKRQQALQDQ